MMPCFRTTFNYSYWGPQVYRLLLYIFLFFLH